MHRLTQPEDGIGVSQGRSGPVSPPEPQVCWVAGLQLVSERSRKNVLAN